MMMLKSLRNELIIFLLSLLTAVIILLLSHGTLETAEANKKQQSSNLENTKNRYHTAVNHKRIVEEFNERYSILLNNGKVGEDNRLNWIDSIEKATEQFKIPYVKYRIDQRKQLTDNTLTQKFPGIDIYSSSMQLEMQLLHEGDLYSLLNNLQENVRGIFDVQQCSIRKNRLHKTSIIESTTDKNFAAVCTLSWYSILPRANKPAVKGRQS